MCCLFIYFARQVTKEGFACVSSPLVDQDPKITRCLRGVLAPKNLIKNLEKEDSLSTSPNTRNGGLKRTLSVTDGNNLHEIKKKRFLNPGNIVQMFKSPNPLSTHLEHSSNNELVHIFFFN